MNGENVTTAIFMVVFIVVFGAGITKLLDDEYVIQRKADCIQYEIKTGDCAEKKKYWAVVEDNAFASSYPDVFVCGDDYALCNAKVEELNRGGRK